MTKLKKHQLLEKAMRDYPKGTVAYWVKGKERILSGVYEITPAGDVFDNESNFYLFDQNKWAEILPESKPSILEGKVAIQVNNEREFKLLMEHYEEKGWIDITWINQNKMLSIPEYWTYDEECWRPKLNELTEAGYVVIPFSDFALELGIKVPKFIMKSEDGVDLYEGDCYYEAHIYEDKWQYINGHNHFMTSEVRPVTIPEESKAFSTPEAAKSWIKEQNVRKEIVISPESQYPISVSKEGALILCEGLNHVDNIRLKGKEIEEMHAAYRSLNGKEVENNG